MAAHTSENMVPREDFEALAAGIELLESAIRSLLAAVSNDFLGGDLIKDANEYEHWSAEERATLRRALALAREARPTPEN